MKTIDVSLGRRSYKVVTGPGVMENTAEHLSGLNLGDKALLVTNPRVFDFFGKFVEKKLEDCGFSVSLASVPDGEEYKNLQEAEKLYDAAFSAGLDRSSPVVALGGGVIGDLAGFAASTYMRGVPLVQIPTTLLAQVDSSVGGKVAVNHPRGKNIVGAFYQPVVVIADSRFLESLPERELKAGLAEVIKYGVIKDDVFFDWLEDNIEKLLAKDYEALAIAVEKSCRIKARIVEEDETEENMRAILNFGHTVGHALESLTEYKIYQHGEAVAIGMVAAARLAEKLGYLNRESVERLRTLIIRTGLPADIPEGIDRQDILHTLKQDKKVYSGELTFVLPVKIGEVIIKKGINEQDITKIL